MDCGVSLININCRFSPRNEEQLQILSQEITLCILKLFVAVSFNYEKSPSIPYIHIAECPKVVKKYTGFNELPVCYNSQTNK